VKQLKILISCLLFFLVVTSSFSQSTRLFNSYSATFEIGRYPDFLPNYYNYESFGLGVAYALRYNVLEIGDNVSIGLDPSLVLGLHMGRIEGGFQEGNHLVIYSFLY